MEKQNLAILGSTGSIGTQALEIIRQHPDKFNIVALSAHSNWELLAEQTREFKPDYILISDSQYFKNLKEEVTGVEVLSGSEMLPELASKEELDTVLNALVGFAGFESTLKAIQAGKRWHWLIRNP